MISSEKLATYSNQLNLTFNALIALPLLAFIYLYLETTQGDLLAIVVEERLSWILIAVIFALSAVMTFFAFFGFRRQLAQRPADADLWSKLVFYKPLVLRHYFMLVLALCLMVIGFYFSQSRWFLVGFVMVMVALARNRPSWDRIAKNLQLDPQERRQVMKKE